MASTVQVTAEQKAQAAATNVRTQYQSLHAIAQTLAQTLKAENGYSAEQLKAALGDDLATIQKAIDNIT